MPSVLQPWVHELSLMQQSVLLGSIRGPDGVEKYSPAKGLLRWFRRCILISAFDKVVLTDPYDPRGGSFTGPSLLYFESKGIDTWEQAFGPFIDIYVKGIDAMPAHFQHHFLHAVEVLGFKHPDERIRTFWNQLYICLVEELNLNPETEEQFNKRLGDNRDNWLKTANKAVIT